jgi:hypothetical protein
MAKRVTLRLTPDEVALLVRGLDELEKAAAFTRRYQPNQSEQTVGAVTESQAVEMLKAILEEAR